MSNIVVQHCDLPIDCPATCDSLKEIPGRDEKGEFFLQLCTADCDCQFKRLVNYTVDADIQDK